MQGSVNQHAAAPAAARRGARPKHERTETLRISLAAAAALAPKIRSTSLFRGVSSIAAPFG
jgi:hypothetical protein